MKSFRIVDTKFRILSKGRVGMFAAIAVGAMMTIGASNANATTYNATDVGTYLGSSTSISNTDGNGYASYNSGWSTSDSRTGTLTISSGDTTGIYVTGSMNSAAVSGYPYVTTSSGNAAYWNADGTWNGVTGNTARDYLTTTLTTRNYVDGFNTVINLTDGATIGSGGIAINVQDDTGGSSVLNLSGADRTINGSIYVDDVNLLGWTTTFNGSVYSNIDMSDSTAAVFTNAATSIGAINGAGTAYVYLNGNNSLTGTVTGTDVNLYLSGNDITFNDNVTATVYFTAAGQATFANGADLTGNVSFGNHNAALTLSNGSNVTGSITGTGTDNGTLNFEGSSIVSGDVGLIKEINVGGNASRVQLNTDSTDTTTVNALNINADLANVEVNGLLTANTVSMGGHYSKLELLDNDSASATVSTVNSSTGASTSATYSAEGMKGTLNFGTYNATTNVPATGTQGKGTLEIGDNVDVTFSTNPANGINAVNANNATLVFAGSSAVGGNVGTSHTSTDTFNQIWAGATGETVTFANDVYVGVDTATATTAGTLSTASAHNLTTGSGTVNLNGNLYGNLVIGSSATPISIQGTAYSSYGDAGIGGAWTTNGTVNIAHNKTVEGSITTAANGTGTLNFMGSSSYGSTIGTSGAKLAAVTFNSASVGNGTAPGNATNSFTETINNNVYATTVTIGNAGETATTAKATSLVDATGSYDYAGATNMQVWTGGTVANIGSSVTSLGDNLVLSNARDAINLGTAHVAATSFTTNNGAMSFTVNTQDITGVDQAASTSTGSGQIAVTTLNMSGSEKIQVNYVGSLKDAGTYNLITASAGASTYSGVEGDGKVSDNSYVIDTKIAKAASGNLILTADRTANTAYAANQLYVEKSNTVGHLSNNAATVLAGIAATGSQTDDMVQVIQKMEIDSFGYGNNQQNLETQVKRLAPIANASLSQSAISANTLTLNTVSNRIADLRGDSIILPNAGRTGMSAGDESAKNGAWVKLIASTATQEQDGMYDGYKTNSRGLAMGIDHKFKYDIIAGLAFGYTLTNIDQQDFRDGDTASTKSYNVVAYASKDFERAYVEGALSYAHHNTDSQRVTAVGRIAEGDIDANQYTAHLSAGYRFNVKDKATVTPFLALDYTHLAQDAYTETGAGAINLDVDALSTNRTTFGGGLRVGTKYDNGSAVLRPELKLAAYHISGGSNTDISAQYIGGGEKFVTPGTDLNNMMYNIGLGLKAQVNEATSLGFTVDYDRSSNGLFQGYTGQLVGRYEF